MAKKREVAHWVRDLGIPLTVNVVIHRENIERIDDFVALAESVGAHRLELANAQYLGWALANRRALLPTREALARARPKIEGARKRLAGTMEVVSVLPDYYADRPRACMDGWGRRFIVVSPDGLVLPCHLARTIPGLEFERAGERPLATIWSESVGLNAFRGEAWMTEPCRGCDRRSIDFGGCRCQAFHLTGDAAATDPACRLAPAHARVLEARSEAALDAPPPIRLRRARG